MNMQIYNKHCPHCALRGLADRGHACQSRVLNVSNEKLILKIWGLPVVCPTRTPACPCLMYVGHCSNYNKERVCVCVWEREREASSFKCTTPPSGKACLTWGNTFLFLEAIFWKQFSQNLRWKPGPSVLLLCFLNFRKQKLENITQNTWVLSFSTCYGCWVVWALIHIMFPPDKHL